MAMANPSTMHAQALSSSSFFGGLSLSSPRSSPNVTATLHPLSRLTFCLDSVDGVSVCRLSLRVFVLGFLGFCVGAPLFLEVDVEFAGIWNVVVACVWMFVVAMCTCNDACECFVVLCVESSRFWGYVPLFGNRNPDDWALLGQCEWR